MTIQIYKTDNDYYTFTLSDGSINHIGKQTESNPDGAASYEGAIEILKLNFPDLEL